VNQRAKGILVGLLLAFGLLALAAFATDLREAGGGVARWGVFVSIVVGVVAVWGAAMGSRDMLIPGLAALVLAWPVLAGLGIFPAVPTWIPLLRDIDTTLAAVLVGALVMGAATKGRAR
jgi:hypothetical protein